MLIYYNYSLKKNKPSGFCLMLSKWESFGTPSATFLEIRCDAADAILLYLDGIYILCKIGMVGRLRCCKARRNTWDGFFSLYKVKSLVGFHLKTFEFTRVITTRIIELPICGGIKQCKKYIVIFKIFPLIVPLFGWIKQWPLYQVTDLVAPFPVVRW